MSQILNTTIIELYANLCIEYRDLAVAKKAGAWKCSNCKGSEADHYDGKCTTYVTSLSFRSDKTSRLETVERLLWLLDQIKAEISK